MSGDAVDSTRRQFVAVAVTKPVICSAVGIDGGAIFQILAVDNLGLDPRAIGIAFGAGVLSVPIQLAAARLPLWRARSYLQAFLLLSAALCWIIALLVGLDVAGEPIALVALGVTVAAEVIVSVLYAPSWQPLLKYALTSQQRQELNSRWRAAGGVLLATAIMAFGAVGAALRTLVLVVVGAGAALVAIIVSRIPAPEQPMGRRTDAASPRRRPRLPAQMRWIYLVLGLAGLTAMWPLFLVYASEVLWPTASLGLLGAIQLGGSLVAAAAWRSTDADLASRASRASGVLVATAAVLAVIRAPVTSGAEEIATVVALAAASASAATILLILLEDAHRAVDNDTSVKALTVLDVVESTFGQLGLLIGGFLVAASASRAEWRVDPYRLYLLAGALLLAVALAARSFRLSDSSGSAVAPRGHSRSRTPDARPEESPGQSTFPQDG